MKISFDTDDTIIKGRTPRYKIIQLLLWFYENTDWEIIVWSANGEGYALNFVRKLGIEDKVKVIPKGSEEVDISVDDKETGYGKVDIIV